MTQTVEPASPVRDPGACAVYVVVGAGFSGIAVAAHLMRRLQAPARICLVNRNHRFGRGLAYGTRSASHLLNVPAGRMSIDPADPDGFLRYLRSQGLACGANDFVPRKLYGEYLEAVLEQAQEDATAGVTLSLVQAEVCRIQQMQGGARVFFEGGEQMQATGVILAIGHFPPRPPCGTQKDWHGLGMANDPWAGSATERMPRDSRVLLVGSGLTAYDVALTLLDRGHQGGIMMVSRRGLLPQTHREQDCPPSAGVLPPVWLDMRRSMRKLLHDLRELIRAAGAVEHDWRDVLAGLRPHTPQLWQGLDERARRQFLRHVLPYWETHRHRAAPAIHRRIQAALASGQLSVVAGRVEHIGAGPGSYRVQWRPRGAADSITEHFEAAVNCTGPSADLRKTEDMLIATLRAQGAIQPDPLGLGLEVDGEYRILDSGGWSQDHLRYVGPFLKAQWWEATAVPELRTHAWNLSALIAQEQSALPQTPTPAFFLTAGSCGTAAARSENNIAMS